MTVASSLVLIEKVAGVTDTDSMAIAYLRPGTRQFTLPGFTTVKRDAFPLVGQLTVNVHAELKVGSLEETVTETAVPRLSTSRRQKMC